MMKLYELHEKVAEMNEKHKVCKITVPHDLSADCCMFIITKKNNEGIEIYWENVKIGYSNRVTTCIKEKDEYPNNTWKKLEKMLEYVEKNIKKFDEYDYWKFFETL